MRILSKSEWLDGFLDEWRSENDYRIQVKKLVNLEQLDEVYFVRRLSPRMLLNYLRELGPLDVARRCSPDPRSAGATTDSSPWGAAR